MGPLLTHEMLGDQRYGTRLVLLADNFEVGGNWAELEVQLGQV